MRIEIDGRASDLSNDPTADLQLVLRMPDPQKRAAAAGLDVPRIGAIQAGGRLQGSRRLVSFDGRIFVVRRHLGWYLMVLRPEGMSYGPRGLPDLSSGAFSDRALIQDPVNGENALALCEENADDTPYRCDGAGARSASGPYDCYDFWVLDSNAESGAYNGLRRRRLFCI